MTQKHKQVRHYHEPGDLHELTFSCYQQLALLTNDNWRHLLFRSIDRAVERHQYRLVAFVLMPEHVHLLVFPTTTPVEIDNFLTAIKQPFSVRIKSILLATQKDLLQRLTIRERPDKVVFRFWQEGPGYDRNLSSERAVRASVDYIHLNPVRRGLVVRASDWKWSSARWYESEGRNADPDLPRIHGLPWEFFT